MSLLFTLVFWGAAIWISQKAKPLGTHPYRWGLYIGLTTAWMSLWLAISAIRGSGPHTLLRWILFLTAGCAAISSLGILCRKRFGMVPLAISYAMLILISPFVEPAPDQPYVLLIRQQPASIPELIQQALTFPATLSVLSAIGAAVFTFVYFRERWSLLR